MTAPDLHLQDLRVSLGGRQVLSIPEHRFPGGSLSTVEGENGSGKTTLLLAAAGLLDLDSGQVLLGGHPFHQGRAPAALALRRRTAFAFQEPYFFTGRVLGNVAFGLKCRGVGRRERLSQAGAVLDRLGLQDLRQRQAFELSGGERRLVGLARALVLDPEVLFLDEPTAALDQNACQRVESVLRGVANAGTTTLILSTHDQGLAGRVAALRLRLQDGRQETGQQD